MHKEILQTLFPFRKREEILKEIQNNWLNWITILPSIW